MELKKQFVTSRFNCINGTQLLFVGLGYDIKPNLSALIGRNALLGESTPILNIRHPSIPPTCYLIQRHYQILFYNTAHKTYSTALLATVNLRLELKYVL